MTNKMLVSNIAVCIYQKHELVHVARRQLSQSVLELVANASLEIA